MKRITFLFAAVFLGMAVLYAVNADAATKKPAAAKTKAKPQVKAAAVTKDQLKAVEDRLSNLAAKSEEADKKLDKKMDSAINELDRRTAEESAALSERIDNVSSGKGGVYVLLVVVVAGFFGVVIYLRRFVSRAVGREVELRLAEIKASGAASSGADPSDMPAFIRKRGVILDRLESDGETSASEPAQVGSTAGRGDSSVEPVTAEQKKKRGDSESVPSPPYAQGELFSAQGFFDKGVQAHGRGLLDEAVECYSKSIEGDGNFAAAYNHRGLAYAEKKDYARAIEDFGKAIMLDNKDARTYLNIIEVLTVVGEFARALEILQKGRPCILGNEEKAVAAFWENVLKNLSNEDTAESEKNFIVALEEDFSPAEWSLRLVPAWLESSNLHAGNKEFIQNALQKFREKS